MNLLQKIKMKDNWTTSEQLINTYLLKHLDRILEVTLKDIQEACFVSYSSIYRYCKKLKAQSFQDVKLQLYQSCHQENHIDFNFPFQKSWDIFYTASSLKELMKKSLDETQEQLDYRELRKGVRILQNAKTIYFLTSSSNTMLAHQFKDMLEEIQKEVQVVANTHLYRSAYVRMTSQDAVILISYAANTSREILSILPKIAQKKVPILLIGSTHNQSFAHHATCTFFMCDKEDPVKKIYNFSSYTSAMYILWLFYAGLYQMHYDQNIQNHMLLYASKQND